MLEYAGTFLTIDHFKDGFSGLFVFFPIFAWKDLCYQYIVYYGRISCVCNNVSLSGFTELKQWICKLYPDIDIGRLRGHVDLVLQLHDFVFGALFSINFLLCELIMLEIFPVQEQLTFTVFLLNVLRSLLDLGNGPISSGNVLRRW